MAQENLIMLAVGDLIFEEQPADVLLKLVETSLKLANVLVGQGEVTYTMRPVATLSDKIPNPRNPDVMTGLCSTGFNVITLAGNHVWDMGKPGIEDTISWLRNRGIMTTGAGINIKEARRPALIERNGTRFGFLAYNCVGPKENWASADKSGCAYVNIVTHYELDHANPGGTPSIYTTIDLDTLEAMQNDIRKLRPLCDVLVVSFHKGLVHTPIEVLKYERHLSYAAIDSGADLILGHHAHILHGIEVYKGRAIFHSLGNFAVSLRMSVDPNKGQEQWALRRKRLFNFEPDPEYPTYPFHPEAVHTIIVKCVVNRGMISRVSYLPCLINKKGQPEILKHDQRGQDNFEYVDKITREAGLNARFEWDGDEVLIGD